MRTLPTPKPPQPSPKRGDSSPSSFNDQPPQDLDALISQLWPRSIGVAVAKDAYTSDHPMDLTFEVGDEIEVLAYENAEWWNGRCLSTGRFGSFPSRFVKKPSPKAIQQKPPRPLPKQLSGVSEPEDLPLPHSKWKTVPKPADEQETSPHEPPPLPRRPEDGPVPVLPERPSRPGMTDEASPPRLPPRPYDVKPALIVPPRPKGTKAEIPPRPGTKQTYVGDGGGQSFYEDHDAWRSVWDNEAVIDTSYRGPPLQFTESDFVEVDAYVHATPESACRSISSLARYLTAPYDDDLLKIRSIFKWVTDNISYDVATYRGLSAGAASGAYKDAEATLRTRTGVCEQYSSIFQALMDVGAPEIFCKKVSGGSLGGDSQPGDGFMDKHSHAWNVVLVRGEYRMIESTWGAGNVDGDRFDRCFNPHFFLTRPQHAIFSHIPRENPEDQFLTRPISFQNWMRLPYIHDSYYFKNILTVTKVSEHGLDGNGGMLSFLRTNTGRLDIEIEAEKDIAIMAKLDFPVAEREIPNKELT
ncbi:hypothetical protein HDU67_002863, partial [Dinochytrium kinnereticum]